ncbi:FadR/GntR family transcriptional regulator [Rosenbergiella australiborealis]|uniref:FadR family transcriptional regulator n=1 Tax=Rosenbergiella australiborealis TaxID=1544696 RepID=A0ABS5T7V9_9GAMM|nr:GntR family transcriptional regulator [Rosenbergiella australiborealis]MBT0727788.1 FadR family transcriptional regulator [Rosenbergiella australiborealis]
MITHTVIFAPIGEASRTEQITQRLSNAIISGLLEKGEQLPNESELARMMGVSHITIRDALNTLRNKSLIYTVRGRNGGSFISDNIEDYITYFHPFNNVSSDFLADLGEMQSALIIHSARLSVRRMTEEDLALLNNLVETLAKSDTPQLKTQSDMRCLLTLAANSQSSRLAGQELIILTEWAPLISLLYKDDKFHPASLFHYKQLINALMMRDESLATTQAHALIEFFISSLIEYKMRLS